MAFTSFFANSQFALIDSISWDFVIWVAIVSPIDSSDGLYCGGQSAKGGTGRFAQLYGTSALGQPTRQGG
jgi:hypothetical protein